MLDEASSKWNKMYQTYYKHPTIAKMVSKETRIVPENIKNVLSEESERIAPIMKEHPELAEDLKFLGHVDKAKAVAKYGLGTVAIEEFLRRGL
jgi:hypothetical protein